MRFKWTKFYEAIADALRGYIDKREELTSFILSLAEKHELSYLHDKGLEDIDPFTVMGLFNRGITNDRRQQLAKAIAEFLKIESAVPESFEAIPILNNQKSCFFWGMGKRTDNVINELWSLFNIALDFADDASDITPENFSEHYDIVASHKGILWNLTMGLYWIRPWFFPTLESQSQGYLATLSIKPELNGPKKSCTGKDYLLLRENLSLRFAEDAFPVHSFPELSLHAWQKPTQKKVGKALTWKTAIMSRVKDLCLTKDAAEFTRNEFQEAYVTELSDLFPENSAIESTIDRHMQLLRDDGEIEFVKSGHYEWLGFDEGDEEVEPEVITEVVAEEYSLESIIKDGCFLSQSTLDSMLSRLKNKKNIILQGPPGTGKTWLGKRLAYALIGEKQPAYLKAVQFHPNLSYEDFIKGWRPSGDGKLELCDGPFLEFVKLAQQNPAQKITSDDRLGAQFQVGHSYVTPAFDSDIKDAANWFSQVVETEIFPLLEEYWFDDPVKAQSQKTALLKDL